MEGYCCMLKERESRACPTRVCLLYATMSNVMTHAYGFRQAE